MSRGGARRGAAVTGTPPGQQLLRHAAEHLGVSAVSIAWHGPASEGAYAEGCDVGDSFQAASTSKTVAALAALSLHETSQLDLDAPVNDQLRSWVLRDSHGRRVTTISARTLLRHAGQVNVRSLAGYPRPADLDGTARDSRESGQPTLLDILEGRPPASNDRVVVDEQLPVPTYSGGGYCVVQQLIADATGEPFAATAQRLVIEPARMTGATFDSTPASRAVDGFVHGNRVPSGHLAYPCAAAAGMWCTATDLARLGHAITTATHGSLDQGVAGRDASGAVVTSSSAQEMLSRWPGSSWGQGVEHYSHEGREFFGHNGGNTGFSCQFLTSRLSGVTVALMVNSHNSPPLLSRIMALLFELADAPGIAATPRGRR